MGSGSGSGSGLGSGPLLTVMVTSVPGLAGPVTLWLMTLPEATDELCSSAVFTLKPALDSVLVASDFDLPTTPGTLTFSSPSDST